MMEYLPLIAFLIMSLWGSGGGIITNLAALQGVPTHLQESMELDGANAWHRFWHLTVPMVSPVIFYNVIMGIIGLILTIISSMNMKKRREEIGTLHTTLAIGKRVMFAGGIYGKVVRMNDTDEIIGVEVAPKTVIDISRFAVQEIVE
jgi:preprotein translocase YajC subunit